MGLPNAGGAVSLKRVFSFNQELMERSGFGPCFAVAGSFIEKGGAVENAKHKPGLSHVVIRRRLTVESLLLKPVALC